MLDQWREPQMSFADRCATSPWTEPYQAASERPRQSADAQRMFEADCQRPTHDALSEIYNRE